MTLPHPKITPIPNNEPEAIPELWNSRYLEIDNNFDYHQQQLIHKQEQLNSHQNQLNQGKNTHSINWPSNQWHVGAVHDCGWHKCGDTGIITQWLRIYLQDLHPVHNWRWRIGFPVVFPYFCTNIHITAEHIGSPNHHGWSSCIFNTEEIKKESCTVIGKEYVKAGGVAGVELLQNMRLHILAIGK